MNRRFHVGDPVIYRALKRSPRPGPRAENVKPEPLGEDYVYEVDKYWVVVDASSRDKLLLRTRRGKEHLVDRDDPQLRRPKWWERFVYRRRFPGLD